MAPACKAASWRSRLMPPGTMPHHGMRTAGQELPRLPEELVRGRQALPRLMCHVMVVCVRACHAAWLQEAADSPFLEGKLEAATGVLCVLRMTRSSVQALHALCSSENLKEHALRAAVQVGGGWGGGACRPTGSIAPHRTVCDGLPHAADARGTTGGRYN